MGYYITCEVCNQDFWDGDNHLPYEDCVRQGTLTIDDAIKQLKKAELDRVLGLVQDDY